MSIFICEVLDTYHYQVESPGDGNISIRTIFLWVCRPDSRKSGGPSQLVNPKPRASDPATGRMKILAFDDDCILKNRPSVVARLEYLGHTSDPSTMNF